MILNFEFSIPKNTTKLNPHVQRFDMGVNASFIRNIEVVIPQGHKGLAYMRVSTQHKQILPANGFGYIRGNEQTLKAAVNSPVPGVPYYLICEGYNEDSFLSHSFILNIEV